MLNLILNVDGVVYDLVDDLNIWTKNYSIGEASPRTVSVDVPYRNGSLDLTEALGGVTYRNRTLKFTLAIIERDYLASYNRLNKLFNGKRCTLKLQGENDYYYTGRAEIGTLRSDRMRFNTVLTVDAEPFKYKATETVVTVLGSYGGTNVTLENSEMPVKPYFLAGSAMTISCGNVTHNLTANQEVRFDDIILTEPETQITVTGSGNLTIRYREGIL